MPPVRVRFAPSPTGYLHVGGARTALFNWLFARRQGGVYILRIEDTDADRSRPELTEAVIEGLRWLGLEWDEGPFHQSERLESYRALAARLEKSGHAYPCFCTPGELDLRRKTAEKSGKPWKYDGRCRALPAAEVAARRAGQSHAIRFRVPASGETRYHDLVFGEMAVAHNEIEDFVLLRSDRLPTYHLGVGGRPPPVPLIPAPDKTRLSKRHGATSVTTYRDEGFLPEAFRNFLALLGWSPGDDRELMPTEELVQRFSLEQVSRTNAVFDRSKLEWFNAEYLRSEPLETILPRVEGELRRAGLWREEWAGPEASGREWFARAVDLLRPRARLLTDFSTWARAFFADEFDYDPEAVKKFLKDARLAELLPQLRDELEKVKDWSHDEIEKAVRGVAERAGVKAALLINSTRVAVTGQAVAPPLFDTLALLGQPAVVARLQRLVDSLSTLTR